jgi:hypothetical protein
LQHFLRPRKRTPLGNEVIPLLYVSCPAPLPRPSPFHSSPPLPLSLLPQPLLFLYLLLTLLGLYHSQQAPRIQTSSQPSTYLHPISASRHAHFFHEASSLYQTDSDCFKGIPIWRTKRSEKVTTPKFIIFSKNSGIPTFWGNF